MPSIPRALEIVCEVFCEEEQWPPMIQAWKRLRDEGILPVSKGKAVVPATTEHLAILLLTIPSLLYYRRTVSDTPSAVLSYCNLLDKNSNETAISFISRILEREIISVGSRTDLPVDPIYNLTVHLDRPQIDYTETLYVDKWGFPSTDYAAAGIGGEEVRTFDLPAETRSATASRGPGLMRAMVEFPSEAIRKLARAWLDAGDGSQMGRQTG